MLMWLQICSLWTFSCMYTRLRRFSRELWWSHAPPLPYGSQDYLYCLELFRLFLCHPSLLNIICSVLVTLWQFFGSEILNDFFKPIAADIERLKSIKKHRIGRKSKQLERYEQKMKEERQKRIRERQKEFFSEIEVHRYAITVLLGVNRVTFFLVKLIVWLCSFNSKWLMTSFLIFLFFVFLELTWTPGKDWKMYSKWRENVGKVSISMLKSSIKGRNGYIVRRLTESSVRKLIYWKSMMLRDTLEWFRYGMTKFLSLRCPLFHFSW